MDEEIMREKLAAAAEMIREQQAFIEQVTAPPLELGTVINQKVDLKTGRGCVVSVGGSPVVLNYPEHLDGVKLGDIVTISKETGQITESIKYEPAGNLASVLSVKNGEAEVEAGSGRRRVYVGRVRKLEKGDRVILDSSSSVVLRNLGKEQAQFSFSKATNVRWSDIGGLTLAKEQMREAIEMPFQHADLYRHYGKKPVKGVLLYGPPGCGKTMLGKAAASALADLHGASDSNGFLYVKGPEVLERYVGVAEASIRNLFERTREHQAKHGYPAVVFIDEADAILGKRGTGISSDVNNTIVPAFLTEMDGLEDSGALVILATNRADVLDPAVVRDGRIDRKVKVTRPTEADSAEIFNLYLSRVPRQYNAESRDAMAEIAAEELFSSDRALYSIELKGGAPSLDFTMGNLVNGGMIAGIVDQATTLAMRRDIANPTMLGNQRGLCSHDLVESVERVYRQNRDLNHADDLQEFVEDFRSDVVGVRRLAGATA
jgi:proteasome-associated ATPase